MQAKPGQVARNVEAAASWFSQGVASGADLVVFPEAVVTGYATEVFRLALPRLEDLAWLAPLQEAVDKSGSMAVINTPLARESGNTLTSLVIRPRSEVWAAYDKQHLYPVETEVFRAGDHGTSFEIDGVEVALSICYDANFPEHAADAAASGASVYVNSGAYFPGGASRRDLHYASRALDNGMYVVFAGLVGPPSGFIGGSAIYDPVGRPLARLATEPGLAIADVDLDMLRQSREEQRMWADRRESLGTRHRKDLTG